jgi:hypothetical protein
LTEDGSSRTRKVDREPEQLKLDREKAPIGETQRNNLKKIKRGTSFEKESEEEHLKG